MCGLCAKYIQPHSAKPVLYAVLFFQRWKINLTKKYKMEALTKIQKIVNFKNKYFTNNFYWVNENNYKQLQEIAITFGCLLHTGKKETIQWHEGFKNIAFRTYEKNKGITVFQKEAFLSEREMATSFDEMLVDFKTLLMEMEEK